MTDNLILDFTPETLPQRIRAMRKARQWTLEQLADQTGLSVAYLSDIERGEANPSIETLEKLANAFGGGLVFRIEYRWQKEEMVYMPRAEYEHLMAIVAELQAKLGHILQGDE